jgi:hypothetical protein
VIGIGRESDSDHQVGLVFLIKNICEVDRPIRHALDRCVVDAHRVCLAPFRPLGQLVRRPASLRGPRAPSERGAKATNDAIERGAEATGAIVTKLNH